MMLLETVKFLCGMMILHVWPLLSLHSLLKCGLSCNFECWDIHATSSVLRGLLRLLVGPALLRFSLQLNLVVGHSRDVIWCKTSKCRASRYTVVFWRGRSSLVVIWLFSQKDCSLPPLFNTRGVTAEAEHSQNGKWEWRRRTIPSYFGILTISIPSPYSSLPGLNASW